MNAYRQQQLAAAALIESGATAEQVAEVYGWTARAAPERSIEADGKRTLTPRRKCGIIKAIRRNVRRWKRKQEVKNMYKWVKIYSIDFCVPDGMTARVKATYNDNEKVYEISRRAFLQACKKIGTDEHAARCTDDVYTQTGRSEGSQSYNLKTGIRPLTW